MFQLIVENENNVKLELSNSPYFKYVEIDGLLPGNTVINSSVMANTDGSIINSARAEEKEIQIKINPNFPVEENRQRLYTVFKRKKYVTLYYKNQNRDLKIKGMVQNIDGSLFEKLQLITIDIYCESAYLEDQSQTYTNMSQVLDLFEFPFSINDEGIEFSRVEQTIEQNVYNAGDTDTGIIIEMIASGTVVKPVIYNVDTRESFGINFTMQAGDLIRINTNQFTKRIDLERNGQITNIINSYIKGNKWFKLVPGDNLFTYACEQGEEFLTINFIHSNLYEGV